MIDCKIADVLLACAGWMTSGSGSRVLLRWRRIGFDMRPERIPSELSQSEWRSMEGEERSNLY